MMEHSDNPIRAKGLSPPAGIKIHFTTTWHLFKRYADPKFNIEIIAIVVASRVAPNKI
ncbi:MAG: hypothetical protein IPP88_24450 [Betaproteobacteria bacterium]|nr:hypothetical protein [Betaproteobacteria bacterium]